MVERGIDQRYSLQRELGKSLLFVSFFFVISSYFLCDGWECAYSDHVDVEAVERREAAVVGW
jgi:hypothetical protein